MKNSNFYKLFEEEPLVRHIVYGGLFFIYVLFLQISKVYSPITYLFGIPTPTTGITRALIAAMKGNLSRAFFIHPLFLLSVPYGLSVYVYLFYKRPVHLRISLLFALIFLVVYVIRILNGSIYY